MGLETRIPKEIHDYREKIVFGLSARQLLAIAIALAVVGATAFVLWYLLQINFSIVEYILIFEAMPIIAFGFIRYKGMNFEQVARIRRDYHFGTKRLLKQNNLSFLSSLYCTETGPSKQPDKIIRRRRRELSEAKKETKGKAKRSGKRKRRNRNAT